MFGTEMTSGLSSTHYPSGHPNLSVPAFVPDELIVRTRKVHLRDVVEK